MRYVVAFRFYTNLQWNTRPRDYKTVFMLNSTEHEIIYSAHKRLFSNVLTFMGKITYNIWGY